MPKMPRSRTGNLSTPGKLSRKVPIPGPRQGKAFQLDLENYYLRSLRKPDASKGLVEWFNDADVLAAMNLSVPNMSVEDLQNYIGGANNLTKYIIGVFTKPDMKLIGLYQIDVTLLHRRASMHAVIGDKDWWGKGVFRETGNQLEDALFEHRNIDKVTLKITSKNKRILFSLIGTQYEHEGCLRKDVLSPDGQRLDINVFSRLKDN